MSNGRSSPVPQTSPPEVSRQPSPEPEGSGGGTRPGSRPNSGGPSGRRDSQAHRGRPTTPLSPRPTSAGRPFSANKPRRGGGRGHREWTPWKDRIRSHRDAILYVEAIVDRIEAPTVRRKSLTVPVQDDAHSVQEEEQLRQKDPERSCVLSASADGSVRLFDMSAGITPPPIRRKFVLVPPTQLAARCGATMAAAAVATANGAGGLTTPSEASAAAHATAQTAAHAFHGSAFCTAFVYVDARPRPPPQLVAEEGQPAQVPESVEGDCPGILVGGYECGRLCAWSVVDGSILVDLPGHHSLCITALRVYDATSAGGSIGAEWDDVGMLEGEAGDDEKAEKDAQELRKKNKKKGKKSRSSSPVRRRNVVRTLAVVLSTAQDCTLRAWRVTSGSEGRDESRKQVDMTCAFVLDLGSRCPASDLAFLGSGRIAVGGWDGRLRLLNLQQKACVNVTTVSQLGGIRSLCASEDGKEVHAGCEDCQITSWSIPAGTDGTARQLRCWKAHDGHVLRMLAWGNYLISCSEDRSIRIWSLQKVHLVDELYGHTGAILTACIATDANLLWTGARDWSLRSWDLAEAGRRIEERTRMTQMDKEARMWLKELTRQARERKKGGKQGGMVKTKGRSKSRR
eukprot:TRINITY_DN37066_c0_g1_i1.p1 TRINITY_DN37066_c0_g1~~TRINITY_DN37066_c0_g1_i1.p1  ORF type:complete len:626 (-),score=94.04 TRINITY_DN37066_c0_g1_i1:33-1910(-)